MLDVTDRAAGTRSETGPTGPGAHDIDLPAAERALKDLLSALGTKPGDEHTAETPRRVAAALAEFITPIEFDATTFPNDERYDEVVLVRDIAFHSLCGHHLLPFRGVAHLAYIPGERIIGLSKLARAVEFFARRLQIQEALTMQVANWMQETLKPKGAAVVIAAEHTCMTLRGVQATGSSTVTSCLLGRFRDDSRTRAELFSLTKRTG